MEFLLFHAKMESFVKEKENLFNKNMSFLFRSPEKGYCKWGFKVKDLSNSTLFLVFDVEVD